MNLSDALSIHCLACGSVLLIVALVLHQRRLLGISSSGAWVLLSSALFFLFHPADALIRDDLYLYQKALAARGGTDRVFWMLAVIILGISAFYVAYVTAHRRHESQQLPKLGPLVGRWTLGSSILAICFVLLGVYSIIFMRTGTEFIDNPVEVEYDVGRLVGGATGWSQAAHLYLTFPLILMVFRGPGFVRGLGTMMILGICAFRLVDSYDRASLVSMILAVALVFWTRGDRIGPLRNRYLRGSKAHMLAAATPSRMKGILAILVAGMLGMFLTLRGHRSASDVTSDEFAVSSFENVHSSVASADAAFLPTLYIWTAVYEDWGYDYGVPVVSGALFGWLPRRYFPWKDDLNDFLLERGDIRFSNEHVEKFVGSKATAIGPFYGHGGLAAVLICMWISGLLCVRLDRLVADGKTDMGRCIGIVWMSGVWMSFGSGDIWTMTNVFLTGMPFFSMWCVERVLPRLFSSSPRSQANGDQLRENPSR